MIKVSGGGFFVLNTHLKLLLFASYGLLLTSSLKYSFYFLTNFPFNLKLSQFENYIKFGINYRYLKETKMSCLETAKNFVQKHFLVEKDFHQNYDFTTGKGYFFQDLQICIF